MSARKINDGEDPDPDEIEEMPKEPEAQEACLDHGHEPEVFHLGQH